MNKIEDQQMIDIAKSIATANLTSSVVSSVRSSSETDSTGGDTVLITIVVTPGSSDKIQGDAAIKTLVQIRNELETLCLFSALSNKKSRGCTQATTATTATATTTTPL